MRQDIEEQENEICSKINKLLTQLVEEEQAGLLKNDEIALLNRIRKAFYSLSGLD